jgi:hypothetical protein
MAQEVTCFQHATHSAPAQKGEGGVPDAAFEKDKLEPVEALAQMLRSATSYLLPELVVVPHD